MQTITQRQKLIRLADRSEFGWDAVNEYEKDELADNDDDARHLEKVEKAAEQKALRTAPRGGNRNKARRPNISPSGQQYLQPLMGAAQTMLPGGFSQPRGASYRPTKIPGPCFHCLKMGHLKANCPELKSYPFLVSDVLTSSSSSSSTSSKTFCSSSSSTISSATGNLTKGCNNISSTSSMLMHVSSCSSINSVKQEVTLLEGGNIEVPKPGLHHTGDSNLQSCEIPKVPFSSVAMSRQLTSSNNCPAKRTSDSLECDIYDIYQPHDEDPYETQVCATRFWEREQGPMQDKNVQGRLKQNYNFWKDALKASQPVLDLLAEGYKLPLLSIPPPHVQPNQSSSTNERDFVSTAINQLLELRCIRKVSVKPHICSPLFVVTNTEGKKRLVVNLRFLNQYLLKEKFKYEDLRTAMLLFQKGDFLITFDLKSGYHHIDIHKQHWTYLGFSWALDHEPEFYVFCVLPFGLATACYVFTKVMRPLVKYWRQQGIRVVVYLDDGLVAVEGM